MLLQVHLLLLLLLLQNGFRTQCRVAKLLLVKSSGLWWRLPIDSLSWMQQLLLTMLQEGMTLLRGRMLCLLMMDERNHSLLLLLLWL